jgi:predicted MPP superfamily phosphohydrolase
VVPLGRLPQALDGFTIAQISDLHFGFFLGEDHIRKVVDAANALRPDFVALTGDFVNAPYLESKARLLKAAHSALPCGRALAGLRPRLGLAAVLGNNDFYCDPDIVAHHLESAGLPVLRNRALALERGGARLWIAGIDDALHEANDIPRALHSVGEREPVVALVHEPDIADVMCKYPIDLQLSGHSHGGQVRIPGVGAPILPGMGRKYPIGLQRAGNMAVYTNRGIGTTILPVRVLCPPELTLLTLRSG